MDAYMDLQMKKGLLLLMICQKYALNLKNINLLHFRNGLSTQFLSLSKITATVQMKMLLIRTITHATL
jgi:hypothetical protein